MERWSSVATVAMRLKFIKRAESLHAIKFFGFPIHGQFDHGQAIAAVQGKRATHFTAARTCGSSVWRSARMRA